MDDFVVHAEREDMDEVAAQGRGEALRRVHVDMADLARRRGVFARRVVRRADDAHAFGRQIGPDAVHEGVFILGLDMLDDIKADQRVELAELLADEVARFEFDVRLLQNLVGMGDGLGVEVDAEHLMAALGEEQRADAFGAADLEQLDGAVLRQHARREFVACQGEQDMTRRVLNLMTEIGADLDTFAGNQLADLVPVFGFACHRQLSQQGLRGRGGAAVPSCKSIWSRQLVLRTSELRGMGD